MRQQFCCEEVELHNTEQDCWVVLGADGAKKVYDITAFLEDHPGGPELLLDLAGQDVQEEFEVHANAACAPSMTDIGHSKAAREMLQELCIGELRDDREAQSRREARKVERRSLLLMQSPVMDKLYAEQRQQDQPLQHRLINRAVLTHCAMLLALVAVLAYALSAVRAKSVLELLKDVSNVMRQR